MTKLTFGLLLVSFVGALPQVPKGPGPIENWPVIQYDGPRYEMTPEMFQERLNNKSWERPADMPIIPVEPGTILDLSYHDSTNGTLNKRSGTREITAFSGTGCPYLAQITQVKNFGCGTGCITLYTSAVGKSGYVRQQYHGNPYPTMDVWETWGCSGQRLAHFGVIDTGSCTDTPSNKVFRSFIGYWNC